MIFFVNTLDLFLALSLSAPPLLPRPYLAWALRGHGVVLFLPHPSQPFEGFSLEEPANDGYTNAALRARRHFLLPHPGQG